MPNNDNIVYEISRLANDKNLIQNDMNDAAGLVMEMFRKKYIDRLGEKISGHRKHLMKNPTKEIQLISALKQFMPEDERNMADKAVEAFILADTLARFKKETMVGTFQAQEPPQTRAVETAAAEADSLSQKNSVHDDGVYDIDESCVKKNRNELTGILMFAAMLMR